MAAHAARAACVLLAFLAPAAQGEPDTCLPRRAGDGGHAGDAAAGRNPVEAASAASLLQLRQERGSSSGHALDDSDFVPVDGGSGRACRGANSSDNSGAYYTAVSAQSVEECQTRCMDAPVCHGIEYGTLYHRCELWTRTGGIGASRAVSGYACLRHDSPRNAALGHFSEVGGGTGRACRGADPGDNLGSYFTVVRAESLEHCKAQCVDASVCHGVEYGARYNRCEFWTRAGGIGASEAVDGYVCLRYEPPTPAPSPTPSPAGGLLPACTPPADGSRRQCETCLHGDQCQAGYFCCPFMKKCVSSSSMSCSSPIASCRTPRCHDSSCQRTSGCDCDGCANAGPGRTYEWLVWANLANSSSGNSAQPTCHAPSGSQPSPSPSPAPSAGDDRTATRQGCNCRLQVWQYAGNSCDTYCCNPDDDQGGDWCFVQDTNCEGSNWGYCSAGSSPTPTPSPSPTPTPVPPPPPSPTGTAPTTVSARAWDHFQLLNALREEGFTCPEGANFPPNDVPLQFDCRLWRASQLHSQDMADQDYFAHTALDGDSPWDRANQQGISANGENIAAGRAEADEALDQWHNSDGHCRNMGNAGFRVFAVGYAAGGSYRHYWTQMFKISPVELDTSCYPPGAASLLAAGVRPKRSAAPRRALAQAGAGTPEITGEPWVSER